MSKDVKTLEYNFDNIVLESREKAETVLSGMNDLIKIYGVVSVADLYDLVGTTGSYMDNKYGWVDLHDVKIIKIRAGYSLKLPKVLPIY